MYADLIDQYEAGGSQLAQAIEGLTPEQLTAFPVPGTWSIQQIVIHMLDSDVIGTTRMKRMLAEDHPTLQGYDESRFAERLAYDQTDAQQAAQLFSLMRSQMATVLRAQAESVFERTGFHTEDGEVTLGKTLKKYIEHLEHHLGFIERKRALLVS